MTHMIAFGDGNSGFQLGNNYGSITNEFHASLDLDKELPAVDRATFDSYDNQHEERCLPGTRIDILCQIKEWASLPQGRCIFWLNGMAGTGKSTISRTVAESFSEAKSLGASFFFKRGEADRGNAKRLFPTIARQLTISIPQLLPYIKQAVLDNSGIIGKGLKAQFDKLLLQPLLSLRQSDIPVHTVVIVIDALDECEGDNDIRLILQLLPQLQKLDTFHIRVFLTSRPELPIHLGFSKIAIQDHKDLILHEIPDQVIKHDISLFLHWRLSEIRNDSFLPDDWPGETKLEELVALSVPLFIFAATICRIFEDSNWDPIDSLTEILAYRHNKSNMDRTYLPVLDRLLIGQTERQKKQLIEEFQQVVGSIVILEEPLSVISLSKLLNLPERLIQLRLKPLHSVLKIPADRISPVRLFHLSFRDFLLDPEACNKTLLTVDEKAAHYTLAVRCLSTCRNLQKNICRLTSDGDLRAEIDRLTVDHYIPPELRYSCRYWVYHLVKCNPLKDILHQALLFLEEHFLHWVEAMSLLGFSSEIVGTLNLLQKIISVEETWNLGLQTLEGHSGEVRSVAFSPDGRLLVSGSGSNFDPKDNTVRIWDATTGALQQTLEGHSDWVNSVAFSPDGRLLASSSSDKTVRLWDIGTGALQQTLKGHGSVAFSPDGQLLASESIDKTVRLWDPATGALQQTLEGHSDWVRSVAFSPDGRLLASGSDSNNMIVQIWDLATGALQQTLEGHSDGIKSVVFSPDGRLLASGSDDKTVRLWDLTTGALQQTLNAHSDQVLSVAFSPDGRLLASSSYEKTVRVWDTATGALQQNLEGSSGRVNSVAFSPDGRLLASGSWDKTVRLWDTVLYNMQQTLDSHSDWVNSIVFSPDGRLLASSSEDKTVRLWDTATGALQQTLEGHSGPVGWVAFSPNSRLLVSGSGVCAHYNDKTIKYQHKPDTTVRLWDTATGALLQNLQGHSDEVNSAAFSPDNRLLVSGSKDKTVQLWDLTTDGLHQTLEGHLGRIQSVAFSPDGRLLASGSDDRTVRLWNTVTGALQQTLEGHSDWVRSVAFSPDSRLLASGSDDNTVRLWDTVTGALQQTLDTKNKPIITKLEFSLEGSYLITNFGSLAVQSEQENHASHPTYRDLAVFVENRQWIKLNGKNVLRLPHDFRPSCSAISGYSLALGHPLGRVSLIRFCV